jgi:hypothetical protein
MTVVEDLQIRASGWVVVQDGGTVLGWTDADGDGVFDPSADPVVLDDDGDEPETDEFDYRIVGDSGR